MKVMGGLAAVVILALTVGPAVAGDQDFELLNKTGVEIAALYVSPSQADEWGEDILGVDVLPDGESVHIKFSRKETAAKWDIRIEDGDGNSLEWEGFNLLEISKIALHYNAKTGKATAKYE